MTKVLALVPKNLSSSAEWHGEKGEGGRGEGREGEGGGRGNNFYVYAEAIELKDGG